MFFKTLLDFFNEFEAMYKLFFDIRDFLNTKNFGIALNTFHDLFPCLIYNIEFISFSD